MDKKFYPVTLICPDKTKITWTKILDVFKQFEINCSNLNPVNEGFKAYFPSQRDVDLLFSEDVTVKLAEYRCSAVKPPYLTTSRTIIVLRANKFIMEHSKQEIEENINDGNESWLKIRNLYKFPSEKTFKFECSTLDMAEKCLKDGFFAFNLSVHPHDLSLEEASKVQYCFKCYALDDHVSKNCGQRQAYKICSLCSSTTHTYKECKSATRKCVNCQGPHATMSRACPKYKEAISRNEPIPIKNPVYRNVTAIASTGKYSEQQSTIKKTEDSTSPKTTFGISRDDMLKVYMIFVYASSIEAEKPGNFNVNLDKLLKANNLPTLDVADLNPPSIFTENPVNCNEPPTSSETQSKPTILETDQSENSVPTRCDERHGEPENTSNPGSDEKIDSYEPPAIAKTAIFQPSRHSLIYGARNKVTTRSNIYPCTIFTRKGFSFGKGKVLRETIKQDKSCIYHSCADEATCIKDLTKLVLIGDFTTLQVIELNDKKFDEKRSQLISCEVL